MLEPFADRRPSDPQNVVVVRELEVQLPAIAALNVADGLARSAGHVG